MTTQDDARTGLRERKKQETRIALSWAAIRLAVERGFANVRVEDIAAEVGVTARTFNNYFSGKAEAVATRQLDRARRIAGELRDRPASEPLWEAIEQAVLAQLSLGQGGNGRGAPDEHWVAGIRLMLTEPAVRGELARIGVAEEAELAAAIADRTGTDLDRDMYPHLVAAAVSGAFRCATLHWVHTDAPGPVAPKLQDAIRQLAAGLPVP
ncbi:TetR family transcriptional regulator [Streptomyces sp. HNM0575]|uniref:acyl-CoA-like ligand-binding transcription factor n=1 Tax=Streptomyces sp. HNM0575 TaxID=2716338 RepID=UPI00145DB68D|nr:TetR family transcriptional regulator [Streptomyces sp. HNM0575]NLU74917.1 TetR family transcriptional regulator [Streptomyces sp. HNM0575]